MGKEVCKKCNPGKGEIIWCGATNGKCPKQKRIEANALADLIEAHLVAQSLAGEPVYVDDPRVQWLRQRISAIYGHGDQQQ